MQLILKKGVIQNMKKIVKEYLDMLENVSASEWLMGLMIMCLVSMLSLVCRNDKDNKHLSGIFAGQAFYYAFRSLVPVSAFLRERMAEEFPEEEALPEAAPETAEA